MPGDCASLPIIQHNFTIMFTSQRDCFRFPVIYKHLQCR